MQLVNASNIFAQYIEKEDIFNDKNTLSSSFIPQKISHRDGELQQMGSILAPVLRGYIRTREKANIELPVEEKRLCDIMTAEPKHVDMLSRESKMPAQKVLGILLSLELKGIAKQAEGKKFFLA